MRMRSGLCIMGSFTSFTRAIYRLNYQIARSQYVLSDVAPLFLICYSAKSLLGHHALVWMVGFRMAGFMLSGSGIRVFVLGNMGLEWGGWGKVQVNDGGGWGCGRDEVWRGTGMVVCVAYWSCSCQVNVLQCTLECVETVVWKIH